MASESQEHQFLTRPELAARWRCTRHAIDNLASRGNGPRYRLIGGRALYLLTDIEDYERVRLVDPVAHGAAHEQVA